MSKPQISRIIKINLENETDLTEVRRTVYYGERNGIHPEDSKLFKIYSGENYSFNDYKRTLLQNKTNSSSIKNRAGSSRKTQFSLRDIQNKYKDDTKHLFIKENDDKITIDNLVVKEEKRNKGIGQKILSDIISYADKNDKLITLTPTREFGTYERLKNWYKKNGFVENKGKNADLTISDTMYKLPKNNIRFSLQIDENFFDAVKNKVDSDTEVKDLVAVHNLSQDKLLKAIQLGRGLPVPSIAITRTNNNYTNFGDISVVFDKNTIDPQLNYDNEVYDRDVWSPVTPKVEVQLNRKKVDTFEDKIEEKLKDYPAIKKDVNRFLHNRYINNAGDIVLNQQDFSKDNI